MFSYAQVAITALLFAACGSSAALEPEAPLALVVAGPVHIGDIAKGAVYTSSTSYAAGYSFTVHDAAHAPVEGAVVTYSYTSTTLQGSSVSLTCTTNVDGRCGALASARLPKQKRRSVTVAVAVADIALAGASYDASANHDPDGDSDGTQLTIVVR